MNTIGIDQYGHVYKNLGKFPRRALMERLSGAVSKMYIDDKEGNSKHIGYVIGGNWVTLYKLEPFK